MLLYLLYLLLLFAKLTETHQHKCWSSSTIIVIPALNVTYKCLIIYIYDYWYLLVWYSSHKSLPIFIWLHTALIHSCSLLPELLCSATYNLGNHLVGFLCVISCLTDMPWSHPYVPLMMEAVQRAALWQNPSSHWVSLLAAMGPKFHPMCVKSMNYYKALRTEISLIALGVKLSCGLF